MPQRRQNQSQPFSRVKPFLCSPSPAPAEGPEAVSRPHRSLSASFRQIAQLSREVTLQMRKLRHRAVKGSAQDRTVSKSNPEIRAHLSLKSEPMLFSLHQKPSGRQREGARVMGPAHVSPARRHSYVDCLILSSQHDCVLLYILSYFLIFLMRNLRPKFFF